ncbi:MAG: ABC transporter ATP-binding protein/permease [Methylacidiphilales bacterium]|nr:ABC transporter ATP-binding protein/permease [Candidatus Methylacidiphilales bacterium]MDW8348878.1 ABC transporter ATP-binding protein [Verrucomicrobiae bacterium]
MKLLWDTLIFGWPYLRRYWFRFTVGILSGLLFAAMNVSSIWALKYLSSRMESRSATQAALSPANPALPLLSDPHSPNQAMNEDSIDNFSQPTYPLLQRLNNIRIAFKQTLHNLKTKAQKWADQLGQIMDPWFPKYGRPLDWRQFIGGLLLFPAIVLIRGIFNYTNSYCIRWVSQRFITDLRHDVLEKLYSLSMNFFNKSTLADISTRLGQDSASIFDTMNITLNDYLKHPATILGIVISMFAINWQLTLIALFFIAFVAVPMRVLTKKIKKAVEKNIEVSIKQGGAIFEALGNIRVVKAYNLEKHQLDEFDKHSAKLIHYSMKQGQASSLINPLVEMIMAFAVGTIFMYVFITEMKIADLLTYMLAVGLLFNPIKSLASVNLKLAQSSVNVKRLFTLLNEQPQIREPAEPVPLPHFTRAIEIRNVTFSYDDEEPVLKNITLTIPKGLRLGIAGESGSGKSTLINLLLRFFDPTSGEILFDDINIKDLSFSTIRSLIALVSQEVAIFNKTVAENIALGKPHATRDEIIAAAKAAYAHEFIEQMPHGYDTVLGERGSRLSGGQRQRIAIARAFIRNAPILILDEATAALDAQAESIVQAAIDRLSEERTVIAIAHRLSTLAQMHRIIVMHKGAIVETGTFSELLAAGGHFAEMARRQGIRA